MNPIFIQPDIQLDMIESNLSNSVPQQWSDEIQCCTCILSLYCPYVKDSVEVF